MKPLIPNFPVLKFPIVDDFGRKVYLRNRDGSLVLPRIDEATLQDIATRTGGRYFRATDPASLRQAYREVGNLERSRIVITGQQEREDRSWIPLMVALAALVLEGLLRLGPWAVLRLERRLG